VLMRSRWSRAAFGAASKRHSPAPIQVVAGRILSRNWSSPSVRWCVTLTHPAVAA
jgi:hypothetical protein